MGLFNFPCGWGCFLKSLVLLKGVVLGLALVGEASAGLFIPFDPGDFFPPLRTSETGTFLSAGAGSFSGFTSSLSSFSFSLLAAAGKHNKWNQMNKIKCELLKQNAFSAIYMVNKDDW